MSEFRQESAALVLESAVLWDHPALQTAGVKRNPDSPSGSAAGFVRYLRRRKKPSTGYSTRYVSELRRSATAAQVDAARLKIESAMKKPVAETAHCNPVAALGAETLLVAADEAILRRIGEWILSGHELWEKGPWGTTRGICVLLRCMLSLSVCPDEPVIAALAWLVKQIRVEWAWARTWSERNLGCSGHNWWHSSHFGYYQAGTLFPEIAGLDQFRSFGPDFFERELMMLTEPDGYSKEHSGYHWGTAREFVEIRFFAEDNGVRFSDEFHRRLLAVASTLWKILTPCGSAAAFGDGFSSHSAGMSLDVIRAFAAIFNMPQAKYVAESLSPGWQPEYAGILPFGGRNVFRKFERLPAHEPAVIDTVLPDSGYYFLRNDWTRGSDWLGIDAGVRGSIVSSHDHTGIFGFELYSRGRPVLIDNGAGPEAGGAPRMWRESSAGHNVLTVDGADQIPILNEWRWDRTLAVFVNDWVSRKQFAYFNGVHEGYRHLPEPVAACRRKMFWLRGGYWILIDRVTPETEAVHRYEQHFHVMGGSRLEDGGRLVTSETGGNLLIQPVAGLCGKGAIEPCPYPFEGHDNPDHLRYCMDAAGNAIMVVVMVPFEDDRVPDVRVASVDVIADGRKVDPWEVTGLEISIDGRTDIYVDQHMEWNLPWTAGGYSGAGRLFHSRIVE